MNQNTKPQDLIDTPATIEIKEDIQQSKTSFISHVRKMKSLVSYITLFLVGGVFFITPAAVIIFLNNRNLPSLWTTDPLYLNSLADNVTRLSFLITSIWVTWLTLYFTVQIAPFLIKGFVTVYFGYASERFIKHLEYIPALQNWLTWALTSISAVIFFAILFSQFRIVPVWHTIINWLLVNMVLCLTLLLQRILLQKIAFDFHHVAYSERLAASKREIKIVDSLKKAIKNTGLLDKKILKSTRNSPRKLSMLPTSYSKTGKNHSKRPSDSLEVPFVTLNVPNNPSFSNPKNVSSDLEPGTNANLTRESEEIDQNEHYNQINVLGSLDTVNQCDDERPEVQVNILNSNNEFNQVERIEKVVNLIGRKSNVDSVHSISPSIATTMGKINIGTSVVRKKSRFLEYAGDSEALKLGKNIYKVLSKNGTEKVTVESFYPLFPSDQAVASAFKLFDKDESGEIDEAKMKNTILMIYKEKRNLKAAMSDLSHALGQLNYILYGFSVFITSLLSLPIFNVTIESVIPLTSFFLGLSFVFAGSAQKTFEAIIFLFVTHPYDTGDKVIIDGEQMFVDELSLLVTAFRLEGALVYVPNNLLSQKMITNVRRSGDMWDYIRFHLKFEMSEDVMDGLLKKMIAFLESKPASFRPNTSLEIEKISPEGMVTYRFYLECVGNWQDGLKRWEARTTFMKELKKNLAEINPKFLNNVFYYKDI